MINILILTGFVTYAMFAGMLGVLAPLVVFSEVAACVFESVTKISRYPKNLFGSVAWAGSYTLFAAVVFFTYAGIGYLTDVLDKRPISTGMLRLALKSEDSLWWLSLDGLFIAVPLAILALVVVWAVVMIFGLIVALPKGAVWLFRR